jgi:hypothetical protein
VRKNAIKIKIQQMNQPGPYTDFFVSAFIANPSQKGNVLTLSEYHCRRVYIPPIGCQCLTCTPKFNPDRS